MKIFCQPEQDAWYKFGECGELLFERRVPVKFEGYVYKSYVRPVILYGGEAWRLKDSAIGILRYW